MRTENQVEVRRKWKEIATEIRNRHPEMKFEWDCNGGIRDFATFTLVCRLPRAYEEKKVSFPLQSSFEEVEEVLVQKWDFLQSKTERIAARRNQMFQKFLQYA